MRGRIRIELADNCNMRCIMCQAHDTNPISETHFLDFDLFRRQTRGQLHDWTSIQLGNIGEPTIHPRFAKFIRYLRSETDAEILVITNGKLLNRYADVLNEAKCHLQVSMDSLRPEIHERIRHGSNYQKLMGNIQLLDLDRVQADLTFTLMRSNIDEYSEIIEFCKQHRFGIGAFPMSVRPSWSGTLSYSLVWESLWFCKAKLNNWLKIHYGKDYEHVVSGATSGIMDWKPTALTCNAHENDLFIDAQGCVSLCFKYNLPKLAEMSIDESWHSDTAERFRSAVNRDRKPCRTCDYLERCLVPSLTRRENHFATSINQVLSKETKEAIRYDSSLSDEEQINCFLQDVSNAFAVFIFWSDSQGYKAVRMREFKGICAPDAMRERMTLQCSEKTYLAGSKSKLHNLLAQGNEQSGVQRLLEERFYGYNIVRYLNEFWAVPCVFGPLNLVDPEQRTRSGIIHAISLDELKQRVLKCDTFVPKLREENFHAYNLVGYKSKFWAVPCAFGPLDLRDPEQRVRSGIIHATSLDELKRQVIKCDTFVPKLLEENVYGYNLVGYKSEFWAVPCAFGPLDLRDPEQRMRSGIIRATSLDELKYQVNKCVSISNNRFRLEVRSDSPWRQFGVDANAINPISSMITSDESLYLHWLARECYRGEGEIVDAGCLLGGSTVSLACGLEANPHVANKEGRIHSYDLFKFWEGFRGHILPNDTSLNQGESLLPLFMQNIEPYRKFIQVEPGNISHKPWGAGPIEIFFIDLDKDWGIHNHLMREFFPWLIPGRSIIVQQDWFHYGCWWIHLTMQHLQEYFEVLHNPYGATLGFRLLDKIPDELLQQDLSNAFDREEIESLMDRVVEPAEGAFRSILLASKACALAERKYFEAARKATQQARYVEPWDDAALYDVIHAEAMVPGDLVYPEVVDISTIVAASRRYVVSRQGDSFYALPRNDASFTATLPPGETVSGLSLEEVGHAISEQIMLVPSIQK